MLVWHCVPVFVMRVQTKKPRHSRAWASRSRGLELIFACVGSVVLCLQVFTLGQEYLVLVLDLVLGE